MSLYIYIYGLSYRMLEQARAFEAELEIAKEKYQSMRYQSMGYPYCRDRWHCSPSPHLPEETMPGLQSTVDEHGSLDLLDGCKCVDGGQTAAISSANKTREPKVVRFSI